MKHSTWFSMRMGFMLTVIAAYAGLASATDNLVTYGWETATGSPSPGTALGGNDGWAFIAGSNDDTVRSDSQPVDMSGNWVQGGSDSQYTRVNDGTFSFSIPADADTITLSHVVNCNYGTGLTWMGPRNSSNGQSWRFGKRDANDWGIRDNDNTVTEYGASGSAALVSAYYTYKSTVIFDMITSNMYYKVERPTVGAVHWVTRGTSYGAFTPSEYDAIFYRAGPGTTGLDTFTIDYTQPSDATPRSWVYTFDTADSTSSGVAPSSDGWGGGGTSEKVYRGNELPTGYSGNGLRGGASTMTRANDFLFNYAIPANATEVTLSCVTEAGSISWAGVSSFGGHFRFGVRDLSNWGFRETDGTIRQFGESALAIVDGKVYLAKVVINLRTETLDFTVQNLTDGGSEVVVTSGYATTSWSAPTVFNGLFARTSGGLDTISISYEPPKGTMVLIR